LAFCRDHPVALDLAQNCVSLRGEAPRRQPCSGGDSSHSPLRVSVAKTTPAPNGAPTCTLPFLSGGAAAKRRSATIGRAEPLWRRATALRAVAVNLKNVPDDIEPSGRDRRQFLDKRARGRLPSDGSTTTAILACRRRFGAVRPIAATRRNAFARRRDCGSRRQCRSVVSPTLCS
jgi:hypothetical protein